MQGGQHASRRKRRGADRAADRKELRRITALSAAVVAGVAITTAGVTGIGGAGAAVAETSAPAGTILLSGPSGTVTVAPTAAPTAHAADAPTPMPSAAPTGAAPAAQPGATQGPQVTPSAAPTQLPQETPELRITLAYERHDRDLVITLTFAGYVFRPYSSKTGQIEEYPIPAKRDIGLYEHLDWGDGSSYTAPTKAQRCPVGAEKRMVHEVADRYQLKKKYRKGGDYTISYEYDACGLTNGKIAGQLKMHVP